MTIGTKSKCVEMRLNMWICVECGCAEFDVVVKHCVEKDFRKFSWEATVTKYCRFDFFCCKESVIRNRYLRTCVVRNHLLNKQLIDLKWMSNTRYEHIEQSETSQTVRKRKEIKNILNGNGFWHTQIAFRLLKNIDRTDFTIVPGDPFSYLLPWRYSVKRPTFPYVFCGVRYERNSKCITVSSSNVETYVIFMCLSREKSKSLGKHHIQVRMKFNEVSTKRYASSLLLCNSDYFSICAFWYD